MTESMVLAYKVLASINDIGVIVPKSKVTAYAYANGRESGYLIKVYDKVGLINPLCVHFAMYRKSDQVVVRHGFNFDMHGVHTAEAVEQLIDDPAKAASYICQVIDDYYEKSPLT